MLSDFGAIYECDGKTDRHQNFHSIYIYIYTALCTAPCCQIGQISVLKYLHIASSIAASTPHPLLPTCSKQRQQQDVSPILSLDMWCHQQAPSPSTLCHRHCQAAHLCKSYGKINRKSEISTPCKIATSVNLNLKLATRDYIVDITHHAIFGPNQAGGFPPKYM